MTEAHVPRLTEARNSQNTYTPSEVVAREMGARVLVKLIGPVADGKSTLINAASEMDADFSQVLTTTLQDGHTRSEAHYEYLDKTDENIKRVLDDIENRSVVQYAVLAETGAIYATYPHGYRTRYNLLATLYHASEGLDKLPFAGTKTIGVVARPDAWVEWIETRKGELTSEKFLARLQEGQKSLQWLIDHSEEVHWIVNEPGRIAETAKLLIEIAKGEADGSPRQETAQLARELLDTIYNYAHQFRQEAI